MKFIDSVREAQEHLEHLGLSDIVLPSSESQDSKYCSYSIVPFGKNKKQYILVVPCNFNEITGIDFRDQLITESKEQTALRALYNETGVTTSVSDIQQIASETKRLQHNKKQRQYVYVVNSFFGEEFKTNPSDKHKGDPFFFPLEKLSKILLDEQKWIIFKMKEFLKK